MRALSTPRPAASDGAFDRPAERVAEPASEADRSPGAEASAASGDRPAFRRLVVFADLTRPAH
jgi:hypothetical protein